jgi:3-hydroxybutyryl-CoA dehydrogenase
MKAGIVGYGKMGRGIFSLMSDAGLDVVVLDLDPAQAEDSNRRLEKRLRRAAASGILPEAELARRLTGLRFTTSWDELIDCDLVVEAVFENFDTKVKVLRHAERTVGPEAVIASNTSSLSIEELSAALERPGRFGGYHFFHPVQLTTIAEIITGTQTSAATVEHLRGVSRTIKRTPLVVKDLPGSVINAPLTVLSCEALYILEQGLALPTEIDAIAGRAARIGPCESLDVTGIPFFTQLLEQMLPSLPPEFVVPELCRKLIRDGRHGKYAGKGIFLYREDRPMDDAREYYLNPGQSHSCTSSRPATVTLSERLLYPLYFSVLSLAQTGHGDLADLCAGIQDLIGLKVNPLDDMHRLGSRGLRDIFDRFRQELGPRYEYSRLEPTLAALD